MSVSARKKRGGANTPQSNISGGGGISSPTPSGGGNGPLSSTESATSTTDGRKRQQKRDEQIRKKLESEISKRKNQVGKTRQMKRPPPGTVLSLRPSAPLTMKYSTTIHEAAQFMSAKRENCVLVLDDDESICGVFTAKDLAFKVVGSGLDSKNLTIQNVMTPDPICARTDTNATDALNLMVSKGFRHLPVMDENQNVAGVLDVTKCFFEAMQKLERAYESSRKLYDALEGVQTELGPSSQPAQIISYVEALKQHTEGPDLTTVLGGDSTTTPVFVDVRTSVADAATLMKEYKTTAVLVTDKENITGIFTSKDVVLRVLAAGLDPKVCSVVRVMTPQPDFAPQDMSIQSALRKMHDGHFLNLPIMGDDNEVVGIVDVLKLTYATLEQIEQMNSDNSGNGEGPAWNSFWLSLQNNTDNDSESAHSDNNQSNHNGGTPHRRQESSNLDVPSSPPEVSPAELAQFDVAQNDKTPNNRDVSPDESVSRQGQYPPPPQSPAIANNNNKVVSYAFKFKSPSGRVHRITVTTETSLYDFRQGILEKLVSDELETLGGPGVVEDEKIVEHGFAVSYIDDEGDAVAITTPQDIVDAITISKNCGLEKADLYVHHPDHQLEQKQSPKEIAEERRQQLKQEEIIPGVSNELLLPAALTALAASIVLVFTLKKR